MSYIILLLISIMMTSWLWAFSWKRRASAGVTAFSTMMLFAAIWLVSITLMLLSASPTGALFWYRAGLFCAAVLPVLLLIFIAGYIGAQWVTPTRLLYLFIIPFASQVAIWTDDQFHFFFQHIDIAEKNGLMVIISWKPGFWFIIHSAYSFFLMAVALGWLLIHSVRQFRLFRSQSLGFILGTLVVALPNLAFAIGLIPPDIIVLPFAMLLMGLCFAYSIFHHKLFEVVPIAYDKMFTIMSDGMMVLDTKKYIVAINPAARKLLAQTTEHTAVAAGRYTGQSSDKKASKESRLLEKVIGMSAEDVFRYWPEMVEQVLNAADTGTEIGLASVTGEAFYDVRISALKNNKAQPAGRLILIRDVTQRRRITSEKDRLLEELNRKNRELEALYGLALDANPMTGLPGNNSIAYAIKKALEDGARMCVIHTDLDNFKAFNDKYGFARGDAVIGFTADLLNMAVGTFDDADSFVGHIGGDDFVILVSSHCAAAVADIIIREFDALIADYYDENDLRNGFISSENRLGGNEDFPIMTISMAGVDLSCGRYTTYMEVNDICVEVKKKAKSTPGSIFFMDLRGAPVTETLRVDT